MLITLRLARDAAKDASQTVKHVCLAHLYIEKHRSGMQKRILCENEQDT